MKTEILKYLNNFEMENPDKKILFAVEAGSRSYGTNTENSDYDIRFVYMSKDKNDYLSLINHKDSVSFTVGECDFEGWDVRKALRLLAATNPTIIEWLHSDIVYMNNGTVREDMLQLIIDNYDFVAGIKQYGGMAISEYNKFLKPNPHTEIYFANPSVSTANIKHLLYTVRALLVRAFLTHKYITKEKAKTNLIYVKFPELTTILFGEGSEEKRMLDNLIEFRRKGCSGMHLSNEEVDFVYSFIDKEFVKDYIESQPRSKNTENILVTYSDFFLTLF